MTAARILGIGRTKAYDLARRGKFPCLVIRVGDLYRVHRRAAATAWHHSPAQIHGPPGRALADAAPQRLSGGLSARKARPA